ncbi:MULTISPECIES: GNAT family N-acyltransferase [Rhodopseudomonas]|uniref:L-ornithine N(alpha)-acyltransferase n=1 Tax=Rhodopseudomonas palustris TaxID=1076 RepID=A0A0D7F3X1_RHOPL|nr:MULTISPECIES: GNAT family N-acyltransferase [Rhodopseudomonas]KIZ47793.1 hemolysin [Rhodopseudomonas palustris]MDF3814038.1 GNAT family N-acetyltransferase [Rhodopseudomonas sp. BAL398]WOK16476.1 GNAT family N-acyltransferase [Rhodopseudomonas sp. BAL398]
MPAEDLTRSTQRFIKLLRPENAGAVAHSAITWFKPAPKLMLDGKPIVRFPQQPATLGKIGALEVRLAQKKNDVKRAQKLRYRVFYKDGTAIADAATMLARRDKDAFDAICDHLLVIDHAAKPSLSGKQPVVGTYRLLRQEVADRAGGFYTENEFDISGMVERHPDLRFLELGRSCVLPRYRTKRTVELLWHGIWSYVRQNRVDVMIGCASFDGTDPNRLALPLSFLHHYASAPAEWQASANPSRRVDMNRMAKDAIDPKLALHQLPPLIKGYLRLGAVIGDGAVVDYQFGTTDVLIVMPVAAIKSRYIEHFGADATRHAA